MKEEFLHSLWKLKKIDLNHLTTTSGESLALQNFGTHNFNSGPDFLNGRIKIGDTIWIGHIEIHINSSDWIKHNHQHDKAYDNVILHVVYNHDKEILNSSGHPIPTLELKSRVDHKLLKSYDSLISSLSWIPCNHQIQAVNPDRIQLFLERVYVSRLERKMGNIKQVLQSNKNDWEQTLFHFTLKYFGLKVNGEAFEMLAQRLPHKLILKYAHDQTKLEALLLGQAGLLNGNDIFSKELNSIYSFLKEKHKLIPMSGVEWRFSRMRPANFPTIRLAQIAALYHKSPQLFAELTKVKALKDLKSIYSITPSENWSQIYIPGRKSKRIIKKLGTSTIELIVINVLAPILYSYAIQKDDAFLKEKVLNLVASIKSESNKIIRAWKELGIDSKNAIKSQGLIELKTQYCDQYRCLKCSIGHELLFK